MARSRRRGKTYQLSHFKLIGFSQTNSLPGEMVNVLTKALIVSDNAAFHHYIPAFAREVNAIAKADGHSVNVESASCFAVVIERDSTAKLYIDNFSLLLQTVAKRSVVKGEDVFMNDIGDIRRARFPKLKLSSDHRVIICYRHGWKFFVFFDLQPEGELNIEEMETSVATVMRRLMFEKLYESMDNEATVSALSAKGWFPFNELIGGEFEELQKAVLADFDVKTQENNLVGKFDASRLATMQERWWKAGVFRERRSLLEQGISAFQQRLYIASIKTLITEIEGIFRDRHVPKSPGRQGMDTVLRDALEDVEEKVGGSDSLFFPAHFLAYLRESFFANFDPDKTVGIATRNSVGHGRATAQAYTPIRALQTILVLDQINRYILPPGPPTVSNDG